MVRVLMGIGALTCGAATGYGLMYLALENNWIVPIREWIVRVVSYF